MPWVNSDGLVVMLGAEEATPSVGGEHFATGSKREVEFMLPALTTLTTSYVVVDYYTWLPKNARIEEVEVEVLTGATSGGSATLSLGLTRSDLGANGIPGTILGTNALVNAAAVATMATAGNRLNLIAGSTGAGDLIGTTLAANGLLVAKYATAAFTAGLLRVRVKLIF